MEIMGAFAPPRPPRQKKGEICLREARAELVSLGGAVMLGLCITLTLVVVMSGMLHGLTTSQTAIMLLLCIMSWAYFFDSITEQLCLVEGSIEFKSLLGRRRVYDLEDLEAVLMVHQGFNLERGFETIEFRSRGRRPERVSLGPCWQRNKLESLLHSIEVAMHDPHLIEEVR